MDLVSGQVLSWKSTLRGSMFGIYLMRGSTAQPKMHGTCPPAETRGGVQEGNQGFSGSSERQPGYFLNENFLGTAKPFRRAN